jgi:hypothetical protein
MLVAAALVNGLCAPTLLALKQAGLEYVLLDAEQAQEIRHKARGAERQPALPDVRPRAVQDPPAARMTPSPVRETRETVWPAVWRERLKKTRIAPVVWTYWELGLDLCGTPDPQRRDLLQELLRDLAHPPGTHSFWPPALPVRDGSGEHELEANAPVFWEGVKLLRGRAVMIMGTQALHALDLPDRMRAMHPFQQLRHQGRLLIVLPPPEELIQEARRMQTLREFLRQALAPFA